MQTDPHQHLLNALVQQRNDAMNHAAELAARCASLSDELAAAKERLAGLEAKKSGDGNDGRNEKASD